MKYLKRFDETLINEYLDNDKTFISLDKSRKIIFHKTRGGNIEYAVCEYDDVLGDYEEPKYQSLDIEWLEEERGDMDEKFNDYLDSLMSFDISRRYK